MEAACSSEMLVITYHTKSTLTIEAVRSSKTIGTHLSDYMVLSSRWP
jgi:hypothetical protein